MAGVFESAPFPLIAEARWRRRGGLGRRRLVYLAEVLPAAFLAEPHLVADLARALSCMLSR